MKKEDMMKPCSEEKDVSKAALKIPAHLTAIKIAAISLLIPFCQVFSQVPINGFCKYNSYAADTGFTNFFSCNFNKDSYTDLILFNPQKKKAAALIGNQAGSFEPVQQYNLPVGISQIHKITDRDNKITGYLFSSRKSLSAGIFDFQTDGRIKVTSSIKFNSYPSNINSADINGDGTSEFLVSGSAFEGISIVSLKNTSLKEEKIAIGTSYSSALFSDLSNDGYPDIAAVNVYNNSIDFYYNNSTGSFRKTRSIPGAGRISFLGAVDMNLDYFEDIIYSSGKNITLLYGDAVSSFRKTTSINIAYEPEKIISGDYNRDGIIDLVYYNAKAEILSVIFAKDNNSFYPEIFFMKKNKISDILPFYSKFINGVVVLSSDGHIYTITHLPSISTEVNISIGINPGAIAPFDNDNNGITDLCYIDNFDSRIKFILRNSAGIPYLYYSYPLYDNHSSILVNDTDPGVKIFYCYSPGKKLIEAITVDFEKASFSRQSLYSPGNLSDLAISNADEDSRIYAAYIKNNQLGTSVFTYHNFRFTSSDYPGIAKNVSGINISLHGAPALYFWQSENNKISLSKYSFETRVSTELINASLAGGDIQSVTSFSGDLLNDQRDISIAFIKAAQTDHIIIAAPEMTRILNTSNFDKKFKIPSKKDLYFGETRFNSLKKLIFNDHSNGYAARIDFINQGRNILSSKVAELNDAGGFFVKNMNYKKFHIVYTDQIENCITIKEI